MQITFDTTTITDDEVRGIFALLDTVRPEAFDPGPFDAEGVAQAVVEKIANGGYVHTKETLPGPVIIAEETVEDYLAEVAAIPETDSTGLVWDERIHSSSKALNADGTWRTKRGVDKALVAQVEAELRGSDPEELERVEEEVKELLAAPPAPPAPEAPKAPLAPAVSESAPVETVPQTPSAPVAPSSAISPFVALMKRVTTAQGAGKLTQPRVKELLESLDKKSIMDLRTDEDALASFAVLLDSEGV